MATEKKATAGYCSTRTLFTYVIVDLICYIAGITVGVVSLCFGFPFGGAVLLVIGCTFLAMLVFDYNSLLRS